jgi:hypothetical protein
MQIFINVYKFNNTYICIVIAETLQELTLRQVITWVKLKNKSL